MHEMAMRNEQLALDVGYLVQRHNTNMGTRRLLRLNLVNVRIYAIINDKL